MNTATTMTNRIISFLLCVLVWGCSQGANADLLLDEPVAIAATTANGKKYAHPELEDKNIRTMHNESAELFNAHKYVDAAPKLRALMDKIPNKHDKFYHQTATNYSIALSLSGQHSESIQAMTELVDASKRRYGADDLITARATVALANAHGEARNLEIKAQLLTPVVKLMEEKLGSRDKEYLLTKAALANTYGTMRNAATQKALLEDVLQWLLEIVPPDDIEVIRTRGNLANAYGMLGNFAEQLRMLREVVDAKQQKFGADHLELARSLHNLGLAYGNTGDHRRKLEVLASCLKIKEKHYSETSLEHVITLRSIAQAHLDLSQGHDEHRRLFVEALKRAKNILEQQPQASMYADEILKIGTSIASALYAVGASALGEEDGGAVVVAATEVDVMGPLYAVSVHEFFYPEAAPKHGDLTDAGTQPAVLMAPNGDPTDAGTQPAVLMSPKVDSSGEVLAKLIVRWNQELDVARERYSYMSEWWDLMTKDRERRIGVWTAIVDHARAVRKSPKTSGATIHLTPENIRVAVSSGRYTISCDERLHDAPPRADRLPMSAYSTNANITRVAMDDYLLVALLFDLLPDAIDPIAYLGKTTFDNLAKVVNSTENVREFPSSSTGANLVVATVVTGANLVVATGPRELRDLGEWAYGAPETQADLERFFEFAKDIKEEVLLRAPVENVLNLAAVAFQSVRRLESGSIEWRPNAKSFAIKVLNKLGTNCNREIQNRLRSWPDANESMMESMVMAWARRAPEWVRAHVKLSILALATARKAGECALPSGACIMFPCQQIGRMDRDPLQNHRRCESGWMPTPPLGFAHFEQESAPKLVKNNVAAIADAIRTLWNAQGGDGSLPPRDLLESALSAHLNATRASESDAPVEPTKVFERIFESLGFVVESRTTGVRMTEAISPRQQADGGAKVSFAPVTFAIDGAKGEGAVNLVAVQSDPTLAPRLVVLLGDHRNLNFELFDPIGRLSHARRDDILYTMSVSLPPGNTPDQNRALFADLRQKLTVLGNTVAPTLGAQVTKHLGNRMPIKRLPWVSLIDTLVSHRDDLGIQLYVLSPVAIGGALRHIETLENAAIDTPQSEPQLYRVGEIRQGDCGIEVTVTSMTSGNSDVILIDSFAGEFPAPEVPRRGPMGELFSSRGQTELEDWPQGKVILFAGLPVSTPSGGHQ